MTANNNFEEYLALYKTDLPTTSLPITFNMILKYQQNDEDLMKDFKS